MIRLVTRFILGGLLVGALAGALGTGRAGAQDKKNDCKDLLPDMTSDVDKACEAGGIKRAKTAMKAMQKLAKDKGIKDECDSCHKDEASGDWALTKDGESKFKKMVEAVASAK